MLDTGYLMHISIFNDILSLMHQSRLSLQHDKHNPVKMIRHLNKFTWIMSKLGLIIQNSLGKDDDEQFKTCFKTCFKNYSGFCYQDIKLAKCELTIKLAKTVYTSAISNICIKAEQRFSSFVESAAFSNIL